MAYGSRLAAPVGRTRPFLLIFIRQAANLELHFVVPVLVTATSSLLQLLNTVAKRQGLPRHHAQQNQGCETYMCSNAGHQKREQGSRTAAKFFFVRRIVEELPSSQNQKMRGVRNPSQPMQAGTLERVIVLLSDLRAGVAVRDVAACLRSEAANDSAEHEQLG